MAYQYIPLARFVTHFMNITIPFCAISYCRAFKNMQSHLRKQFLIYFLIMRAISSIGSAVFIAERVKKTYVFRCVFVIWIYRRQENKTYTLQNRMQ